MVQRLILIVQLCLASYTPWLSMSKFLNYRGVDFKIQNENFYATQVSLSAQASVEAVVLNDGSLLNYAPTDAVVGSLSCEFYLTQSIPSYLNITGTHDSAITVKFAEVELTGVYPKSISFNVEPFQPILVSAEFDWYGDVKVDEFKEQPVVSARNKQVPNYVAHAYKSYLDSQDIFNASLGNDGTQGDSGEVGEMVSFSYNSSCDRPAFFKVNEVVPFRVAKLNKTCDVDLSANQLGKLVNINGKNATASIYLKDFYGTLIDIFNISGVLTNQNYNISEGQYLLAQANISQTVTERKVLI